MLKKTLIILTLAVCGFINAQVIEKEVPSTPSEINDYYTFFENEEDLKDLAPGALVCNSQENECVKVEEKDSAFCDEQSEEDKLLACKDCH